MFQQLLHEDLIKLQIEANTPELALRLLIEGLPANGMRQSDRERLIHSILERERYGTTAIGDGIALPHCYFSGVSAPLAMLGISRNGVVFPSLDGEPVYLIFLLILPEREESRALKARILRDAEAVLRDRFMRERLKISETSSEALEIVLREANYHQQSSEKMNHH